MCTIIALNGMRADGTLVLATNRDEFFARPTSGPGRLLEHPRTVAGRDLAGPGTWMGVTEDGLFVGVTNQRGFVGRDPEKRSRGEVVLQALAAGSTAAVLAYVRTLDARVYNDFNLLWGDASSLYVAYGRSAQRELEIERVPPGLHVLPNDRLDSPDFVKVERARALLTPYIDAPLATLTGALEQVLADRQLPPLEAIPAPPLEGRLDRALLRELAALCVRTPGYGTRSSTVVALGPKGVLAYRYADGPPDSTPFVDVTGLFGGSA